MKYMNAWTFYMAKLPNYDEFRQPLNETIDNDVLNKIIELKESDYDHICPQNGEIVNPTWTILKEKSKEVINNNHTTRANQSCKLGRFQSNSFITMPKKIKHTLFSHAGMIDLDQEKGHPRIAYSLGLKNNKQYENIKKYIDNPDAIFNEMATHYGIDINDAAGKNKDRLKWFFNLTIYGGGYKLWLDGLESPSKKDMSLGFKPLVLDTKNILPFMKSFQDDCINLSEKIYANNDGIRDHLNKTHAEYSNKTEYEKRNCVVSYAMQIIENDALHKCYLYLKKNKLFKNNKNVSLEFDGLCFKPSRKLTSIDIEELNKYVCKHTGFDIKYVIKDYKDCNIYNDVIEIVKQQKLDTERQNAEDLLDKSYEVVKARFELKHSKIINSSMVVKKTNDDFVFFNKTNLKMSYEELQYMEVATDKDGNDVYKTKSFIDEWFKDPTKKIYEDVGIYPDSNKCPSNILNMWKPFAMEEIESYKPMLDARDIILNHIKILCDNDDDVYNYFIRWIAQMIQYPEDKSICPIMISDEGAGKGTLLKLLERMLGRNKILVTTTPSKNVWGGSSNSQMKNAFLVNLNEMNQRESYGAEGQIKELITDPTIIIKELYSNPITVNSYHRFIVTSNNDEAVTKKAGDRRKFIIRCSDELCVEKYRKDAVKYAVLKQYHTDMHKLLEDVNVIKTMYNYFKLDIEDMVDFRLLQAPETEHDIITQQSNVDVIESFMEHYVTNTLYSEVCLDYHLRSSNERIDIPEEKLIVKKTSAQLFSDMVAWCAINNIKYDCNNVKFAIRLTRLNIDGVSGGINSKKCKYRLLHVGKIGKHFDMDLTTIGGDDTDNEESGDY